MTGKKFDFSKVGQSGTALPVKSTVVTKPAKAVTKPDQPKAKPAPTSPPRSKRITISVTEAEEELLIKHRGRLSVAEFAYRPLSKFLSEL